MGDIHPKSSFVRRPFGGSVFEFQVEAQRILDGEVMPPLGTPPLPVTADMPPEVRRCLDRTNPILQLFQNGLREEVIQRHLDAGMLPEGVAEPFSSKVEAIIADSVRGLQARLLLGRNDADPSPRKLNGDLSIEDCVMIGARLWCGSTDKAARLLNVGIPASKGPGLNRHHVHRAMDRYKLRTGISQLRFKAEMTLILWNFRVLEQLRKEVRWRREFRGLSGAALVSAIDDRYRLSEEFDRVISTMDRRLLPRVCSESPTAARSVGR